MLKRYCSLLRLTVAALVLAVALPLEAAVRAELDRNRIIEGETVTLTFFTDDARQNLETDFSALENDFEILDRRSETQLSISNGRQTAVVRLVLTLEPKRTGEIVIEPLTFGADSTEAIRILVDPAPKLEPGAPPPVFIEVEIAPGEGPYFVHAQLGLIVRVFYQQNLTEAAISQPEPAPASVRLMQETPYQAERGGERYRVLERNYAVFPERSGELVIPPMQLTGRLVERRSSGVWQPTVRGRRIQVESDALHLTIDPKPAEFAGSEWQPARDYRITQQVSSGDTLQVGEPVTRTVMVDAVGLEENMIVEPAWPELPGARIYPDQPQGITRDDGRWVLGHKEFRYAVVPEQEGDLVLPGVEVLWWDTVNNRQRTAVLEPHTIYVQPSALVPPAPAQADPMLTSEDRTSMRYEPLSARQPGYWRWLALLFAGLWVLTLFAAWRLSGRKRSLESRASSLVPEQEDQLLRNLKRACETGDVRLARLALQHWLREFGPLGGNGSLLEFAASSGDGAIRESVYAMDSDGFRPDSESAAADAWSGNAFWKQFETWRKKRLAEGRDDRPPLTDLYAKANR